jgi:hypothetical protein
MLKDFFKDIEERERTLICCETFYQSQTAKYQSGPASESEWWLAASAQE